MKQNGLFENGRKIANSLTAVAAGILTDILFDMLSNEHFKGTFTDTGVELFSISQYGFGEKCGIVFCVFLTLWLLLAYGIPAFSYVISSWRTAKKPKISTKVVLSTYKECREELISLEERVSQGSTLTACDYILFSDICRWIVRLYNIFCSEKDRNIPSVKAAFRTGSTVYDIDENISSYEYLEVIKSLNGMFDSVYNTIKTNNSKLLAYDYSQIRLILSKLSNVIDDLNINR